MPNTILPTPKTDVVFHSLFRQGNENITKALISAIINMPINSIDLSQDRHLITNLPNDKLGILDLKAILNDNTICNIEVQIVNNKDIIPRLLFYWSNLFYCIGKIADFSVYNKVKFPWTVHICKAKCTCGEATFLTIKYIEDVIIMNLTKQLLLPF